MKDLRRIVLLVDGIHTADLVAALDAVCGLAGSELVLVYVRGDATRRGLELVRHRPGGVGMPGRRERVMDEADEDRAVRALEEADRDAQRRGATVRRVDVHGEAGPAVVGVATREGADVVAARAVRGHLGPAARFIADHAPCTFVALRFEA